MEINDDVLMAYALSKGYTNKALEDLGNAIRYQGQVPTYDDLPTSGRRKGDMWDVADTGMNYIWNSRTSEWDAVGGMVVPKPTTEDVDKVLSVNTDGTVSWKEASGGGPDISVLHLDLPDLRDVGEMEEGTFPQTSWLDALPMLSEIGVPQVLLNGIKDLRIKRIWAASQWDIDYDKVHAFVNDIKAGKLGLLSFKFTEDDDLEVEDYLHPLQLLSNQYAIAHTRQNSNSVFYTNIINSPHIDIDLNYIGFTKPGIFCPIYQIGLFDVGFLFFCVVEYERDVDTIFEVKNELTNSETRLSLNKKYIDPSNEFTSSDTLYLTLPDFKDVNDSLLSGATIEVEWKNGSTVPTIECSLDSFNYIPKANTISKVTFTIQEIVVTETDEGYDLDPVWRIDVEEINDPVNIKETETWTFTLEDGTTVTKNIISVKQSTTQGGDSNG